eukprot:3654716-Pyramimonas_sp.AAC.1
MSASAYTRTRIACKHTSFYKALTEYSAEFGLCNDRFADMHSTVLRQHGVPINARQGSRGSGRINGQQHPGQQHQWLPIDERGGTLTVRARPGLTNQVDAAMVGLVLAVLKQRPLLLHS